MSRSAHPVRDYIDATFAPEDAILQVVRAKGEALRAGMQISAGEGKLLYLLAKMINARRILEIGTFVGYSAIWLARALPHDGRLVTLEADAMHAAIASNFFTQSSLGIELIVGDARTSLNTLHGPFDLVFIDADKSSYLHYLEQSLPLLRTGGLLIGDNSLLFGAMTKTPRQKVSRSAELAMHAFNERMANSDALEGVMIPTDEGLSVARKL